jgi:hypothetical protein
MYLLSSPFDKVCHTAALLKRIATACPIFGRRVSPPAHLMSAALKRREHPSSLQMWCRNSRQRAQLLCCSCQLSFAAFRLARTVNRHAGSRSFEHRAMAIMMKRCYSVLAWQILMGNAK